MISLTVPMSGLALADARHPLEIMLRPESIRLSPPEQSGLLAGEVIGRVYLGSTVRYRVQLPNGRTLAVQSASSDGVFSENDKVTLSWAPDEVRVLSAPAADVASESGGTAH